MRKGQPAQEGAQGGRQGCARIGGLAQTRLPQRPLLTASLLRSPPPAVLALAPGDEDALRCKVAAHMQLSEFQEALALLNKPPLAALPLGFEKVRSRTTSQPSRLDIHAASSLSQAWSAWPAPSLVRCAATAQAYCQYRLGQIDEVCARPSAHTGSQGPSTVAGPQCSRDIGTGSGSGLCAK